MQDWFTKSRWSFGLMVALVLVIVLVAAAPTYAAPKPKPTSTPTPTAPPPGTTQWTVMIYCDGDNSLERYWAQYSRAGLERIPATAGVRFVAMKDLKSTTGTELVEVSPGAETVVATYPEKNFGDGATLTWSIQTVRSQYPSTYFAVVMWDHGYGWRYFCSDDTSGGDRITMDEMRSALVNASAPIDILAFDCCNMADIDVAYEAWLSGKVKIMVASEETIAQNGFPYDKMFTPLAQNPTRTPTQVATDMVAGWKAYYDPIKWAKDACLSAVDITKVGLATTDLQNWAALMNAGLPTYKANYKAELSNTWAAWATTQVDLGAYCKQLKADTAVTDASLKAANDQVIADLAGALIAQDTAANSTTATGLTIWWPSGRKGDWTSLQAAFQAQVAFAQPTPAGMGWWAFLNAYNTP